MSKEAVDHLRKKAQNTQTVIALRDLLRLEREETARLKSALAAAVEASNHSEMQARDLAEQLASMHRRYAALAAAAQGVLDDDAATTSLDVQRSRWIARMGALQAALYPEVAPEDQPKEK